MATILDMNIEQLRALLTAIMPDVQGLDQLPVKKLRIKLTEWLMMNRLSTLHKFESDEDGNWILPGECKSCRRYKIGYLDSSVIFISPSTAVLKQTPIVR
jgi:hypothetical protein